VTKSDLKKYGKIVEYGPLRVVFEVDRTAIPSFTEKILQDLPVDDLDISETPIEEVIQQLFTNK
jgi:ABC-type uncharacterized transport system ATPase subunit